MNATDLIPDIDLEHADSTVVINIAATRKEHIKDDLYTAEAIPVAYEHHIGTSLINLDHYLQPAGDIFYDYPSKVEKGDTTYYLTYADPDFNFNLWRPELLAAAHKRAAEDHTHTVNTLAAWLWQAGNADHVSNTDAGTFYATLRNYIEEMRRADLDVPDWALTYRGDPAEWMHDDDPVTTLAEAKLYATEDGFDAVDRQRASDEADAIIEELEDDSDA